MIVPVQYLWALDPGTRHGGIALFEIEPDRVVAAYSLATNRAAPSLMLDEILLATATWPRDGAVLLSEWPRKYKTHRAAHADIDGLREVVQRVEAWGWTQTTRVAPGSWKGQVPKRVHHARVEAALPHEDRIAVAWATLGPDGRDAVALGLWGLGAGRGRVLP